MEDTVALVRYHDNIRETIAEGLRLLGGTGPLRVPVLIKPNICTTRDGTGHSVSDIEVVKVLVELINKTDNRTPIKIIESDSESKNADDTFAKFGYSQFCKERRELGFDVATLNLSRAPLVVVPFEGRYFKNPELPDALMMPHYFISVAVAKTHYLAYITGVMKNLFGVLPRKDKAFYHSRIHDVITDLAEIIRPDLNIVDARVGIEDWNGPTTHDIGVFLFGKQPVSVDAAMTLIMSLDPHDVEHLMHSINRELGSFSPTTIGESIESVRAKFKAPRIR
jgi:uncharacterized protein (DUF362 family)